MVVVFIALAGLAGSVLAQRPASQTSPAEAEETLKSFSTVYDVVERNYADPVNPEKAIYNGAIPGMLHELDPHSNFFDMKQYSQLREDQRGKYYGVGMTVGPRNSKVIVIAPFAGTPAYRAGLRPGDVIIGVDGKTTENLSTSEVADLLKGPKNTVVRVMIAREGVEQPIEFTLVRDEIPRNSVDVHFLIEPGVGYMHVSSFSETTETEVAQALDEFGDLKGLVLDLRGNPGGLLSEGVGVADKFLKKGALIVSHRGRTSPEKRYYATKGNSGKEYPLVVLVNRLSASAAEIVAGALQDHDRGLIVGENTFGKGLVQTVYPLSENTGLALTTAKYYTPSGRLIQRDYEGLSLYDYYYNRDDNNDINNNRSKDTNREVKVTDSGRTVYGGGGISPDEKLISPKIDKFQTHTLQKYAFFNFAKSYLRGKHVDKNFQVDENVMQDFRKFLESQKIPFTESDLASDLDWTKGQIKTELFIAEFGQEEGLKVRAETDPQVMKALEMLPKAKQLAENANKVVAERNGARSAPNNQ